MRVDTNTPFVYTENMARSIVVANQKGGAGKTTTAVNLASALARRGLRTLVVDLDPQGALTVTFGFDPYEVNPSTYDLLTVPNAKAMAMRKPVTEYLSVIPANAELVASEYRLLKETGRVTRLKCALADVQNEMDYIILDTPPSLGLLTVNALVAANELLIPVATDYLALRGVRALLESVWLIRDRSNPDLRLLGLVPTFYREGAQHSEMVVAEMRKVFKQKVFHAMIPFDEAAAAAPAARKSVLDFLPGCPAALAYVRLAGEVHRAQR